MSAITPLSVAEQDAVIRAKLAVPERTLRSLMKRFTQLAMPLPGSGSTADETEVLEERAAQLLALRTDLASYVSSLVRTLHVSSQTSTAEAATYDAEAAQVQQDYEAHTVRVAELKAELEAARVERGNKLTYDEVVGQMGRMGARSATQEEMRRLEAEIGKLETQSEALSESAAASQQRYSSIVEDLQELAASLGQAQLSDDMDVDDDDEEEAEEEYNSNGGAGGDDSDADARIAARAAALKALNPAAQPFRPATRSAAAATAVAMSAASSFDSALEHDTRKRGRGARGTRGTAAAAAAAAAVPQPALKRRKEAGGSSQASSAEEGEA